MQRVMQPFVLVSLLSCAVPLHAELVLTEGTNIALDVARTDGRIAIDLLGSIWIVANDGGNARRITHGVLPAKGPRWSPDGSKLVFQASSGRESQLWIVAVESGESVLLSAGQFVDQQPSWHPDGERILFSSERGDSGFDLWELDLKSRLGWRLSNLPGDETEGAWSANGRHLAYIHRRAGQWSLMLRRFGEPDRALITSPDPLYAPSWRPDGTLLTFLQQSPEGIVVQMAILSEPPVIRSLMSGADFFIAPLSWPDRQQIYYTADGGIRTRQFDGRQPREVHFAAAIDRRDRAAASPGLQPLAVTTPAAEPLIIRARRLFDGKGNDYRYGLDVLLRDGRIVSLEPRRERQDEVVLDLGDATLLPGLIDSFSSLPDGDPPAAGARLLSYGITAIVSADAPRFEPLAWESEDTPGPRLLRAAPAAQPAVPASAVLTFVPASGTSTRSALQAWQALGVPVLAETWTSGLGLGADWLVGADSLPTSPSGRRYQDIQAVLGLGPITLLSGLADAATPGLPELLDSRQARVLRQRSLPVRRLAIRPDLSGRTGAVVLGSRPNALPPGLALHAELRALEAAGLNGEQVLKAAGNNAAQALRLPGQLGLIEPGALADLVVVTGDPLQQVADALNIVAVVRNGRFYSLVSLLERSGAGANVE